MNKRIILFTVLALALIISACGSAAPVATPNPTAKPTPTKTLVPSTPIAPVTVNVAQDDKYGPILVDSNGMTLYTRLKDGSGTSKCYDACAAKNPPFLTNGAPIAGTGVTASLLGTITRSDGSTQVTYSGWALYLYRIDKVAGDTKGEGINSSWYVISPTGIQISAPQPSATLSVVATP